jgi:hypothetical protein
MRGTPSISQLFAFQFLISPARARKSQIAAGAGMGGRGLRADAADAAQPVARPLLCHYEHAGNGGREAEGAGGRLDHERPQERVECLARARSSGRRG